METLKLYSYFASSASFRARIALGLKGLSFEYVPVDLRWGGGEHLAEPYQRVNPQALVPALVDGELEVRQSLAILEYLEERFPDPPLLPSDAGERARVRGLALFIACEIQPLNNLRVERHLVEVLGLDEQALLRWRRHWIAVGFDKLEPLLRPEHGTGRFCHGDRPSMADCCLVPQAYNAQRAATGLELERWPQIARIYDSCLKMAAFADALPANQPDSKPITRH